MISGRNFSRYGIVNYAYLLLPHIKKQGVHNAVPEDELKVSYTATYKWLEYFKDVLLETRERNSKFYDKERDPFYFLDNVGEYTFSPWKVVWKEQHKRMISCVVSTKPEQPLKGKLIIPDSKVLFSSHKSEDEAHYLCGLLNSKIVTDVIEGYTIELQRGVDVLENIAIPKFDSNNPKHTALADLSKEAHNLFSKKKDVAAVQTELDRTAVKLF